MARDPKLTGGSSMSSVSEDIKPVGGGPVTFINVFEVSVEQIDTFIAQWRERAKIMSTALGFLDSLASLAAPCPLLTDALAEVVNVAHYWDSRQAWEAARRTRSLKPACVLSSRRHRSADLRELKALYQVVVDYGDHESRHSPVSVFLVSQGLPASGVKTMVCRVVSMWSTSAEH